MRKCAAHWWGSRTSNPVWGAKTVPGGFDSHALPPFFCLPEIIGNPPRFRCSSQGVRRFPNSFCKPQVKPSVNIVSIRHRVCPTPTCLKPDRWPAGDVTTSAARVQRSAVGPQGGQRAVDKMPALGYLIRGSSPALLRCLTRGFGQQPAPVAT